MYNEQVVYWAVLAVIAWPLAKAGVFFWNLYTLKTIKDEVLEVDPRIESDRRAIIERWLQKDTLLRYDLIRHLDRCPAYQDEPERVEEGKSLLLDPEAGILAYVERRWKCVRRFPFVEATAAIVVVIERPRGEWLLMKAIPWDLSRQALRLCCARSYLGIHPSELRSRA